MQSCSSCFQRTKCIQQIQIDMIAAHRKQWLKHLFPWQPIKSSGRFHIEPVGSIALRFWPRSITFSANKPVPKFESNHCNPKYQSHPDAADAFSCSRIESTLTLSMIFGIPACHHLLSANPLSTFCWRLIGSFFLQNSLLKWTVARFRLEARLPPLRGPTPRMKSWEVLTFFSVLFDETFCHIFCFKFKTQVFKQ